MNAPNPTLVHLPGGEFSMGSDLFYREEGPVQRVSVAPFWMEEFAVTNSRFAEFVADTGYLTVAERALEPADFPGADPAELVPGSLVFTPTSGPVALNDWRQWWAWMPGASWRHPFGPGSDLAGKNHHPVVQVAFEDARIFAEWAGMRLPSETEWEFAARGGLDRASYAWGEEPQDPHALRANTWQGQFPYLNNGANGWVGTTPVGSFVPNGYGLYDMTGNTWEWTSAYWTSRHEPRATDEQLSHCGCGPEESRRGPSIPAGSRIPQRVLKGGSHLCAPEYCLRYRPAARSPQTEDSAATHIGFRLVRSL